jgi:hypothetical protein
MARVRKRTRSQPNKPKSKGIIGALLLSIGLRQHARLCNRKQLF